MSFDWYPTGLASVAAGHGTGSVLQAFGDTKPQDFQEGCFIVPSDPGIGTTRCGLATTYSASASLSFADAKAAALATARIYYPWLPDPDYCAYTVLAAQTHEGTKINGPGKGQMCDTVGGGCVEDPTISNTLTIGGATGQWWLEDPVSPGEGGTVSPVVSGGPSDDYKVYFNARVVNPTPPWPVPDGTNIAGKVLFAGSDIPADVTLALDSVGAHGPTGELTIFCTLLYGTHPGTPPDAQWMCVL